MILKGIDFANVFTASGTLNFFAEGWPYHRYYKLLFPKGFDFEGSTFISKTTTLKERRGNMPLDPFYQPSSFIPACIKVKFFQGVVLNAVGLSGPGALTLFSENVWQKIEKPFFISFMSVGDTREERLNEARGFVELLRFYLPFFKSSIGVQVNISCPNTKHPTSDMTKDAIAILQIFSELGIPIDLKIGVADASLSFIKEIENSGFCDCLTCSNTIPWGKMSDKINWKALFGSEESPLKQFGGGSLSGWPLLDLVNDKVNEMRLSGITMPIKAGGGVLRITDALKLLNSGVDAIEIGTVAILRPWRVKGIIDCVNFYKQ